MVNATALETTIGRVIDTYGADATYYAPAGTPTYNSEGDRTIDLQTTTIGIKMVESAKVKTLGINEIGNYQLDNNTGIVTGSTSLSLRGKITSGSVNWEITEIRPIEMKGVVIANEVLLRNLLP